MRYRLSLVEQADGMNVPQCGIVLRPDEPKTAEGCTRETRFHYRELLTSLHSGEFQGIDGTDSKRRTPGPYELPVRERAMNAHEIEDPRIRRRVALHEFGIVEIVRSTLEVLLLAFQAKGNLPREILQLQDLWRV